MTSPATPFLYLSSYVLPQLRMGNMPLMPQNLTEGADRKAYLEGAVAFLEEARLAGGGDGWKPLSDLKSRVPFADELIDTTGGAVGPHQDAIDLIHFDADHLTVLFADGRKRRDVEMLSFASGAATAEFCQTLAALMRGIRRDEFLALADSLGVGLDDEVLDQVFVQGGVVEESPQKVDRVAPQFRPASGDRLTWLGHAALMFQSGPTTLWFDPSFVPRIAWRPEDATVFSEDLPDARLFAPYGPTVEQLTPQVLPTPQAVFVTHQDSDHADFGLLATLPETTAIVVPAAKPGRRWDVDLRDAVHRILGPQRNVTTLEHGQEMRIGDVRITAMPFSSEFPAGLPHSWNCYLVETDRSAVAVMADSAVLDEQVDLLANRLGDRRRHTVLMSRETLEDGTEMRLGHREAPSELLSGARLWPWYLPIGEMFTPAARSGITESRLSALVRRAGLRYAFPYAIGAAPWFRFPEGRGNFFEPRVGSPDSALWQECEKRISAAGAELAPIRYGHPLSLG